MLADLCPRRSPDVGRVASGEHLPQAEGLLGSGQGLRAAPSTTILVSLRSSPPSPVRFSPPQRVRSVSSRSSRSSDSSAPYPDPDQLSRQSLVSPPSQKYTVETTVPVVEFALRGWPADQQVWFLR